MCLPDLAQLSAVYGIGRMDKSIEHVMPTMALVSTVISIIICFIVLILFYKFYSHNRFAGYCKLLSHEEYEPKDLSKANPYFSWELVIGRLRCFGHRMEDLVHSIDTVRINKLDKEQLKDRIKEIMNSKITKGRFSKGIVILFKAIFGSIETHSWAFPPFVTSICFVLMFGFLGAGLYLAIVSPNKSIIVISTASLTLLFQTVMWYRLCKKLFDLMNGCATVESFFFRFIPIRAKYLNSHDIDPTYHDTENIENK